MGVWRSYRLRLQRRRWLIRAFRKRRNLRAIANRTDNIKKSDLLLYSTMRNEGVRLPYFLSYYREMGINHFLFVDNDSTDGTLDYLSRQPDVSVWHTSASYKRSRFGVDWLNWLQMRYGHEHWCLTVDPDEFFFVSVLRHAPAACPDRLAGCIIDQILWRDVAGYVPQGPHRCAAL